MYSKFLKICSLALTIAILISLLPAQVLGAEVEDVESISSDMVTSSDAIESLSDVTETNIQSNAKIVSEIVEGRTEYSKEYLMSNGLNLVVIYPEAVHYKKDNAWKEIDNTLRAVGTGSNARYTNTAGEWTVSFPQQINSNQCVNISRNDYTLSFGLAGELRTKKNEHAMLKSAASNNTTVDKEAELNLQSANSATAIIEERDLTTLRESMEYPETFVSSVFSRMKYDNVYNNTDVVYDLDANSVKESIVINGFNPDLYGYRYTLSTGGMVPVLQDDGSILLYNAARTEVIMTMPAPFMVDNAGETTSDVRVSLVANGTEYLLTYYVPVTWLADENRAWPVILDPIVEVKAGTDNILDYVVGEDYFDSNNPGALLCGYHSEFGRVRTFIKLSNIPDLSAANIIVNATLSLTYLGGSSNTTPVGAHKVNSSWETGTITWANQPSHNTVVEDYVTVSGPGRYTWDITDIAVDWYNGSNTGVMLKAEESIENGTATNWKKFYSANNTTGSSGSLPSMTITYRNSNGIEDYWDYTTVSAGRAGTGYINNFNGNLTWTHADLGFDGNRMPVAISHIYNVDDCADNLFGLGYGWRTNYHQTVQLSESGGYYIWTDGDGTEHKFVRKAGSSSYTDQDGLCLALTIETDDSITITDKYKNTSVFDTEGRLIKLINNQVAKSQIEITYTSTNSKRIDTIKDGVGRIYQFTYNNNLLTKIGYHGANGAGGSEITNVQYSYSTYDNLITITYKDALDSHFNYNVHNLTAATDVDGQKLTFTYSSGATSRVVKTQEYDGTVFGNQISFAYARNKVKISDAEHTQIRYFNDFGNLVSTQDDIGNGEFYQYATNRYDEETNRNELTLSSKSQNTVVNLMEHSSFEKSNYWKSTGSNTTCIVKDTYHYLGSKSLKITTSTSGVRAYIDKNSDNNPDVFSVPSQKTITFSAYVLSANASVRLGLGQGFTVQCSSEIQKLGSTQEWKRIEVSYTNNTGSAVSVTPLFIVCEASSANAIYMDCVQIELSAGASRYNLIENGDFRTTNFWTRSSESNAVRTTTTSACSPLDANAYRITGKLSTEQTVTQNISVHGEKDDVFVLAGWGKANSLPELSESALANQPPVFGLRVTFKSGTVSVNACYVSFDLASCSSGDWQYIADRIVAGDDYDNIDIQLVYSNNANDAYFDGIQLYKEEFGERYTYDSNRNLVSVIDILGQKTSYTYTDNDLTEINAPSGQPYTRLVTKNTYVNHNLKTTEQSYKDGGGDTTTIAYSSYVYDTYGNQTIAQTGSLVYPRVTQATYTTNGNYLATTTDERGMVTTYSYDSDTGMLLSVNYPRGKNIEGDDETITYIYDSMYRLVNTKTITDQNKTMSSTYTYESDLLTKITTDSSIYKFEYSDFDLRTKVSVGNSVLASYKYTDDEYHRLETIDYGNQNRVQYTYDEDGRVIKETYLEGEDHTVSRTVTYGYNALGQLTRKEDSKTGLVTTYFYDTIGRSTGLYENSASPYRVSYTYDELGQLEVCTEQYNATTYETTYKYTERGQVRRLEDGVTEHFYIYDALGRLTSLQITPVNPSIERINKQISYVTLANGNTSDKINQLQYSITRSTGTDTYTYTYAYDEGGNIASEKVTYQDGSIKTTTYVYDSANQLIRENNQKAGKTWVWTYDAAGNIQSKKEYAYTTGTLGSVQNTITYTYDNNNWGDLLTKHGDARISYDEIGNPLNNGTEQKYIWEQGRQLSVLMQATDLAFAKHPEDFVGQIGDCVTFTVEACGNGPFTYLWQVSTNGNSWYDSTAGGYTTASMYVYMTAANAGYLYRCKLTDANGKVIYSHPGKIINAPIVVDTQPEDFFGEIGDRVTFTIAARGTGLTYQWQSSTDGGKNWYNSSAGNYDTPSMFVFLQEHNPGYLYRCKITDSAGNVAYSEPGEICLDVLTVITQPEDSMCRVGDTVTFAIEAHGTGLTYQWQVSSNRGLTWYDSTASGYATPGISLTVQSHHPGYFYRCKVTDSAGNVVYSEPGEVLLPMEQWRHTYNADGLRTQRTNGTVTYKYTYHNSQLTHMVYNGTELHFTYDASGSPMAVVYNGSTYYYLLNQQGDVIGLLNSSGTQVVAYTYDAWGRPLTTTGSMASTLGQINPLRYRGYIYDQETNLYYLQSRYYNPAWGRFINADRLLDIRNLVGLNLFAYCLNNPVNMSDPFGTMPVFPPEYLEEFTEWVETTAGALLYVTKVNRNGYLYEYWVDSNGKVRWSRHHTNHGNSKNHPVVPHDHDWYDDDDGNNTEDPKWQPPNSGFQAPGSDNDHSTKIVAGVAGTVAVGYVIYVGAKWIIAALAAPATGGGSLIVAGVTP